MPRGLKLCRCIIGSRTEKAVSQALAQHLVPAIADHRRDVAGIALEQLALACAHSLVDPSDETWPEVISKLTLWVDRLTQN